MKHPSIERRPLPAEPTVAVIIPCKNEARYIRGCLDCILRNAYSRDRLQVIVVDGLSTDGTRDILREYCDRYPFIRVLDNPGGNKPVGLNLAIKSVAADIIVRMDAHADYPDTYLRDLVNGLIEYHADNIGGCQVVPQETELVPRAIGLSLSHWFGTGNAWHRLELTQVREAPTVLYGCYPRYVFEQIGYFNEHLHRTQDREFNLRLTQAGGRIILNPKIRVTYYARRTLGSYVRWVFDSARWLFSAGAFSTIRMVMWRNLIPLGFVVYLVGGIVVSAIFPSLALEVVAPLAIYLAVCLAVAVGVGIRRTDPLLAAAAMIVFPVTHVAYGVGALYGAIATAVGRKPS